MDGRPTQWVTVMEYIREIPGTHGRITDSLAAD